MQIIVTPRNLATTEEVSFWQWIKSRLGPAQAKAASGVRRMAKGELSRTSVSAGTRLTCESGAIWITSDEGGPDIVLEAGQCTNFARRTSVLVEALQQSRLNFRR